MKKQMANNLERRNISSSEFEVREAEDGSYIIEGYGSVFNSESKNLGGFYEYISPDAFRSADMTQTVALINHDNNYVLGRSPNTLQLSVDKRGLKYTVKLGKQSYAQDLYESIKRGDISSSSFAFTIADGGDSWEKRDGKLIRTINSINTLYDVSAVTNPAYGSATVSARALEEVEAHTTQIEQTKEEEETTPKSYYQKLKLRLLKKKSK
jgi:HK97 family phage prohead protease